MALSLIASSSAHAYEHLRLACIAHGALALVAGLSIFLGFVPIWAWLTFQWLWFIWPLVLVVHPARSAQGVIIPVGVGFLLIVPNALSLWAFTAWALDGFAP